jgi:hypothetical protein
LATAGRVITGAATGIPDIAIAIGNAGVRASGGGGFGMAGAEPGSVKEAPYVGPMVNKAVGVPELPPDASTTRRLLEGGGSALLGGGASSILRAAGAAPTAAEAIMPAISALTRSTVAPTVGSHWGGQAGSYLADKVGLDKETGALIGSIMGGHAGKVADLPASYVDWRFRGQGRDNAAEIAAQAQRQGVTPNAAMLGNDAIQMRERTLANRGGFAGNFTVGRRNDARDQIANAWQPRSQARSVTMSPMSPGKARPISLREAHGARSSCKPGSGRAPIPTSPASWRRWNRSGNALILAPRHRSTRAPTRCARCCHGIRRAT